MNIENLPDVSHLSAEDIIRITDKTGGLQIQHRKEYVDHMLAKIGDLSKVDAANIRKVTDLLAAAKDTGSCGGGIVCGC